MLIVMPSRRVLHEAHLESVATAERVARRPSWTWRDEKPATSPRLVGSWRDVLLEPIVQPSSLVRSATAGPWMRALRDVTCVIVALHRHHAERGAWPDSLASLVGPYLDALPPDAYSGDTLRYEVREGVPYLWSVGEDGVDDRLSAAVTAWTGSPLATAEAANDERTQRPTVGSMCSSGRRFRTTDAIRSKESHPCVTRRHSPIAISHALSLGSRSDVIDMWPRSSRARSHA
jgi:hypothetical protein